MNSEDLTPDVFAPSARRGQCRIVLAVLCFSCLAFASDPQYLPAKEVRSQFLRLLERPRIPLAPQSSIAEREGLLEENGSFASQAGERVPFLMVKQVTARRLPVVIVLHGTGGNKEGQLPLLKQLAGRSFIGFAMDGRFHGERVGAATAGKKQYEEAIIRAWREKNPSKQEHPFYYDTVWDLWRALDYLQMRSDVDGNRIGAIGFSKGGIELWLGAADERIKVAIPAISVQSFRWSLENDQWQGRARTIAQAHEAARQDLNEAEINQRVCRELWRKVIPGILDEFDCPSMIRLFAPRPLLILSGDKDPNCPLAGAKIAMDAAREAYRAAGKPDQIEINVATGVAHRVTPDQMTLAVQWFEKWL
ncbi:MAG TPA: acetylxylan esterase [Acidobacteriota bacterium]|jgi:predicted esterase